MIQGRKAILARVFEDTRAGLGLRITNEIGRGQIQGKPKRVGRDRVWGEVKIAFRVVFVRTEEGRWK